MKVRFEDLFTNYKIKVCHYRTSRDNGTDLKRLVLLEDTEGNLWSPMVGPRDCSGYPIDIANDDIYLWSFDVEKFKRQETVMEYLIDKLS